MAPDAPTSGISKVEYTAPVQGDRGETTAEIKAEIGAPPQGQLHRQAHHQQKDHIADEVLQAAVQEHVGKKGRRLGRRGGESVGRTCGRVEQLFELRAITQPGLVLGMLRADQIPVAQPLHETLIRLHLHEQVKLRLIIEPGLVHELPALRHIRCAAVDIQGQLDVGKHRLQIEIQGLFNPPVVAALNDQVNEDVD